MAVQSYVQEAQPTGCQTGDFWLQPSTRKLAVCIASSPTVTYMDIVAGGLPTVTIANVPAGGTGAAAGGWDTANNRDAAIASINSLLNVFRTKGMIA